MIEHAGQVTILWIILLVGTLLAFYFSFKLGLAYVLLRVYNRFQNNRGANSNSINGRNVNIPPSNDPLKEPLQTGISSTEERESISAGDIKQSLYSISITSNVEISNPIPNLPFETRLKNGFYNEFYFHDIYAKTLYYTGINQNNLRVGTIYSCDNKEIEIATVNNVLEQTYSPLIAYTSMKNVPLDYISHIEYHTTSYHESWISIIYYFILRNLIFFIFFLFTIVLILCFYIPLTMDNGSLGQTGALLATQFTEAIFIFTLATLIIHTILFGLTIYFHNKIVMFVFQIIIISFILLLIVFILIIYLINLVNTGNNSNNNSQNSIISNPSSFLCTCPTRSTNSQTNTDDGYNNHYNYQCTSQQYSYVNYDVCQMNCNVCGTNYYAPFVTFTVFGAIYWLLITFLFFVNWLSFHLISFQDLPHDPKPHMRVIIHGSLSYGYPIETKLSFDNTLKLENILTKYQIDNNIKFSDRSNSIIQNMTAKSSVYSINWREFGK